MRVLGVDPGLTRCGVGVVDGAPGTPLQLVAVGVIRTEPGRRHRHPAGRARARPRGAPRRGTPDAVAVERVFSQHNVRTVMGTAQAGAVAIVCAARRGLPVALHTPSEAKAAVTGNGRADKAQVTAMVTRLLRLDAPPKPADAADALALAICHVWRGGAQARLEAARMRTAARPRQGRSATVIAFVSGRVARGPGRRGVEVGGVGPVRAVHARHARRRCGWATDAHVPTSLVVREESLTLYGFADDDERVVFELLQTASGVGPRLALAMLAVHTPNALRRAVATEDVGALTTRAGHRQEGRPADRAGAQGPPRRARVERRRRPLPVRPRPASWRARSTPALVESRLDRQGRRGGRRRGRRGRSTGRTIPTSRRCCGSP